MHEQSTVSSNRSTTKSDLLETSYPRMPTDCMARSNSSSQQRATTRSNGASKKRRSSAKATTRLDTFFQQFSIGVADMNNLSGEMALCDEHSNSCDNPLKRGSQRGRWRRSSSCRRRPPGQSSRGKLLQSRSSRSQQSITRKSQRGTSHKVAATVKNESMQDKCATLGIVF